MKHHIKSEILPASLVPEPSFSACQGILSLIDTIDEFGNWRLDTKSGSLWWSPRVFEIHGLEPHSGPVKVDAAIRAYHPDDAKTVAWLIQQSITNKTGFTFVMRLIRADKKVRLVQSAATVDIAPDGTLTSIFGVFRDVTDRFSEQDVAESRRHLVRSIIENLPVPMIVLDRDLNYLEISPAWARYYGIEKTKSLIGTSHYKQMPDLPEQFKRDNEQALAGEVVRSEYSLKAGGTGATKKMAAIVFPWRSGSREIGGIIVMLASPGRTGEHEQTLNEIANLMTAENKSSQAGRAH